MHEEGSVPGLHAVQFVVASGYVIPLACGNFSEVFPCFSIIHRFPDADRFFAGPQLFAGIKQAAVAQGDGPAGAVCGASNRRPPRRATVLGAEGPLAELIGVGPLGNTVVRTVPAGEFILGLQA